MLMIYESPSTHVDFVRSFPICVFVSSHNSNLDVPSFQELLLSITPHIIPPALILRQLPTDILRPFTSLALIEVASLRQPALCVHVSSLRLRDISIVAGARHVRAVLRCAAGELGCHGLVDAGLLG